jgi:4-amino-4-deoxy-L-arabinose transferase-like glycosyltransferase
MLKWIKHPVFIVFILTALYFLTRVYNLLSLPIFTDEAIYTRWAQIAYSDSNWRFISLVDGKQPLFIWLSIISMKFVSDPLLATRLVSVFSGFLTMVGLYFLGKELFSKKVGLLASLIYIIYPFSLVYDRMALYDSLVATGAVWSLFFEILLVKRRRLDIALILGMVLGASVLTKTSGFFFIYLLPLSVLLFPFKKGREEFLKWIGLGIISVALAYFYYSVLRLSPFFHIINDKNATFVYPFREWLTHPFTFFIGNLKGVFDWLSTYLTIPILILVILSFVLEKKDLLKKLLLILWFLAPFLALALFGRILYPRFILFMTIPLIILSSYSFIELFGKIKFDSLKVIIFVALCFQMLIADFYILNNFGFAQIPKSDLGQYYNDWPAGQGVKESVAFFKKEASKGPIYIATEGTFGLMPYSLEIYLVKNPNITIEGFWPINDKMPDKVIAQSKKVPTYFVFYQPCVPCSGIGVAPLSWNNNVTLITQYKKPQGGRFFSIYKVNK